MFLAEYRRTMHSAKLPARAKPKLPSPQPAKKLPYPHWVKRIVDEVANAHGVGMREIFSRCKFAYVVDAKAEVAYRLYDAGQGVSTYDIAGWFGVTHTAILNLLARHAEKTGAPSLSRYRRHRGGVAS